MHLLQVKFLPRLFSHLKNLSYLTVLLLFISVQAKGQGNRSKEQFYNDFKKALDKNFSEKTLNQMFSDYLILLTPHSDATRLIERIKGEETPIYPLSNFKASKLYLDNINFLLQSINPNHRILAYLVIAASGDKSKENILLKKIKSETRKGNLIWAGMALLYLNSNHTTPIFDFLVKNEDFGDAHMLPMFIKLNKDSLERTAYNRIQSPNIKAKVLASQVLSVTPLNQKTDALLRQAATSWDIRLKGYAIYSIKELQMGNLLDIFLPFIDSPQVRRVALEALANSPSPKDREYLLNLTNKKQDTLSADILDCFYNSKRIDNISFWLKLLYTKLIPKNYVFFVFNHPLIRSDAILPELQISLQKVNNAGILSELVRALEGRTDDLSIDIMLNLLRYENSTVRYWTAKTLANNSSPRIKTPEVKILIDKGLLDGN